ncbi:MAG: chorismate synthase, partial [Gemmatimonadota bacterium]|nr:chorismate synthase [Gemmatimonadota bacterium]
SRLPGSEVHDALAPLAGTRPPLPGDREGGMRRETNRAGGLEGGMTTGAPLVVRLAMKPLATLMSPLASVDLRTGEKAQAQSERSDVTAVPALSVIAEAVMALVLADAMLEKFGGDSMAELQRNFGGYLDSLGGRWLAERAVAEPRGGIPI